MDRVRIKRAVLTGLAAVGYLLLLPVVRRCMRWVAGPELRILTYHSVGDVRAHETNVASDAFAAHLSLLARAATPVRLRNAVGQFGSGPRCPGGGARAAGAPSLKPLVAVTLDDGYADNLHVAVPILSRHGIPATCFVTAGYVGGDRLLPHDEGVEPGSARVLSWDEVMELIRAGVDIGSHGMDHRRFSAASDAGLRAEIEGSKALVERRTGRAVDLISFPYGRATDYDARAGALARAAGYAAAATAMYGWNVRGCDPFSLRRIGVGRSDTPFTLRAKLNGALDLLAMGDGRLCRRAIQAASRLLGV